RRGAGKELGHDLRVADDLSRPAQGQADHRLPHHGPPAGRRPGLRVTVPDPRQMKTMNAPMADRTKAADAASVEGKNVVKTFGGFTAVDDVSFTIGKGEFVSLIGPSGCGKSTLMLIAAGLQPLSTGAIVVNGAPLDRPLTDIGIVFQDHLLLDFRTALDNVLLQAEIRGLPMEPARARAMELFEKLGIAHAADRYPRQLSGGMRQRVSIARALIHNPSVLMM